MVGVSLLLYSTSNISGTEAGTAAAKSVAATFTFLISVGSIRSGVGYAKLSRKAEKIDGEASPMLASDEPSKFEAVGGGGHRLSGFTRAEEVEKSAGWDLL